VFLFIGVEGAAIAGRFVSNIASNNVIVRDRIIGSDIRE
jgi:hypothetical protein